MHRRLIPATCVALSRRLTALPRQGLLALVRAYRFFLSPVLGSSCRFEPTCSAYAMQALQSHGAMIGGCLTLHRLARCHPWCAGGFDPVPEAPPRLFAFFSHEASTPRPKDSNPSGT